MVNIRATFCTVGHCYTSGQSPSGRFPINIQRFWDSRSQTGFSRALRRAVQSSKLLHTLPLLGGGLETPGQKVEFPVAVLRLPFMFFI